MRDTYCTIPATSAPDARSSPAPGLSHLLGYACRVVIARVRPGFQATVNRRPDPGAIHQAARKVRRIYQPGRRRNGGCHPVSEAIALSRTILPHHRRHHRMILAIWPFRGPESSFWTNRSRAACFCAGISAFIAKLTLSAHPWRPHTPGLSVPGWFEDRSGESAGDRSPDWARSPDSEYTGVSRPSAPPPTG